jgi:hypothetical protein
MSRAEREALFHKCAKTMTSQSISGWFIRSPGRPIWRDNVVDWLLWALFSARTNEAIREWEEELDYYATVMGGHVGYPLRPGTDSEIQCLRLTTDPVYMVHRPFIWYMVSLLLRTQIPHHALLNLGGRLSASSISSLPSYSTLMVSHTIIPANGFARFPRAHFSHCSRVALRIQ